MRINFEQITCGRCSGAGYIAHYGHVYNGVCFGCNGAGTKLTRKGTTAQKAFRAATTIEASELAVGMVSWDAGLDGKDRRKQITSISPSSNTYKQDGISIPVLSVQLGEKYTRDMPITSKVRLSFAQYDKDLGAKLAEAVREAVQNLKGATITD